MPALHSFQLCLFACHRRRAARWWFLYFLTLQTVCKCPPAVVIEGYTTAWKQYFSELITEHWHQVNLSPLLGLGYPKPHARGTSERCCQLNSYSRVMCHNADNCHIWPFGFPTQPCTTLLEHDPDTGSHSCPLPSTFTTNPLSWGLEDLQLNTAKTK